MSIIATYIVPHPPLIVPAVGQGQEADIQLTTDSFREISREIAALEPDTIIILSPHATAYTDYFHISPGPSASGDLRQFGANTPYRVVYDHELATALTALCDEKGFPAGTKGERAPALDHGTIVPLHFMQEAYPAAKYVRIGVSGLPLQEHYTFGMLLAEAVTQLNRKAVVVASGDLSHKLKAEGPYGFSPAGPKLDALLTGIMKSGDFGSFFEIDPVLRESAAECGLRGFVVMAGALDRKAVAPTLYSYEGPFGVGYAVASFHVTGDAPDRSFLAIAQGGHGSQGQIAQEKDAKNGDPYVRLARETLEAYILSGKRIAPPADLPEDMTARQAGVFVSIKKHGNLRGCIGTISPTQKSVAQEIIQNAISSGTDDPRFPPVRAEELTDLVYSVDVLFPAEPVEGRSDLDTERYGVIVTKGFRRGLLLPNLEGVNTVEDQLLIACQKAGIDPSESYAIERFEVVRHA